MMKLSVLTRKWHKWLALVVGVQLLFWTLSGLFMSAVPIEIIKSEHLVKDLPQQVISPDVNLISVQEAISRVETEGSVVGLEIKTFLDSPVFVIRNTHGEKRLIDGVTGKKLSPLSKEVALEVAKRNFKGDASKAEITLLSEKLLEFRGTYPVWQVNFNNVEDTTFYISPQTGKVTAKRGVLWRIYDFLWMLHIMDYKGRTNFNNWLLIFAAILGFATSISGLILIRYSFRKRDFNFSKGGNK